MLELKRTEKVPDGQIYITSTKRDESIYTSDTFSNGKRTIEVSVATGCQAGCKMCPWHSKRTSRPLTGDEICNQIDFALEKEERDENKQLILSFGRVGDPFGNGYHTISAINRQKWKSRKNTTIRVSTPGIVRNPRLEKKLLELAKTEDIELRFSIHSTKKEERAELAGSPNIISFADIAKMAREWENPPIILDFLVLEGYTYNIKNLKGLFSPGTVATEIHSLVPNIYTRKFGLRDADPLEVLNFAYDLRDYWLEPSFSTEVKHAI